MGSALKVTLHAVRPDCPALTYVAAVLPTLSRSVVSAAVAAELEMRVSREPVTVTLHGRAVVAPTGVLVVIAGGYLTAPLQVAVHDELAGTSGVTLGADWAVLVGW